MIIHFFTLVRYPFEYFIATEMMTATEKGTTFLSSREHCGWHDYVLF